MIDNIFKYGVLVLFFISLSYSIDDTHHFRLYITADVKGEIEPCG